MADLLQVDDGNFSDALTWGRFFAITAANHLTSVITVAGDQTPYFPAMQGVFIFDSTGNDGHYTVLSSSFAAGSTAIILNEAFGADTADGNISGLGQAPDLSDNLIAQFTLHFDIVIPNLSSFALYDGTILIGNDPDVDYLGNQHFSVGPVGGSSAIRLQDIHSSIEIDAGSNNNSPTMTFQNVVMSSVGAINMTAGGSLAWESGSLASGSIQIGNGGGFTGGLAGTSKFTMGGTFTFTGSNTLLFGNIDFLSTASVDIGSISGTFSFVGNVFRMLPGSDIEFNKPDDLVVDGEIFVWGVFAYSGVQSGNITIHIMSQAAQIAVPGSGEIVYDGPAGGAMGNFRLGL